MGGGGYSSSARSTRAVEYGFYTKSRDEVFSSREIPQEMNPNGVVLRESRDSEEHPYSFPIIIALDMTGSMGHVPHYLVKDGLPLIMDTLLQKGIDHPQVLFMGIGDYEFDQAPLQIGQFESSDQMLDHWLTTVWLEGKGGNNDYESYSLAWMFAGMYTEIDSLVKRGKKGVLITIGDEHNCPKVTENAMKRIMGPGQHKTLNSSELLELASEKYECFHIHVRATTSGRRQTVMDSWRQLMKDNLLIAETQEDISKLVVKAVLTSNNQSNHQQINQEVMNNKGGEEVSNETSDSMDIPEPTINIFGKKTE